MAKSAKDMLMNKKSGGGKLGNGATIGSKGGGIAGDNFKGKGSKGNKSYCPMGLKNAFKNK